MKTSKIILILIVIGTLVGQGDVRAQESGQHYIVGIANIWITPAFMEEMAALGYVDGENITYMIPSFEGVESEQIWDSYWAQIQAMVDAGADVFVTNTDSDAVNLRERVGDIPIVFGRSDDPVATGAVQDLVTPGGTITGNITNRPHERRLQVLTEINPATDRVYYLYGTQTGEAETVLAQVLAVAEELNIEVIPAPIADLESGMEALENIPDGTDWLFLTPYVPYDQEFSQALLTVSETYQIPISYFMFVPVQGYLMGYGPNIDASDRQAARQVDRILRGASPAILPVQTAENYLYINLEAAEALHMEIPASVLRQADLIVRPGYFDNPNSSSQQDS